ncbi:TetR/AcrR family transcriptional regulator [Pseudonocardia halophobica]|uniref:TetR family transcriptional regulator n=1 Tax=Pseudonocardia halophobica TaxID=29401 RepID=A0A9W6NUX7_9PSEU|nr:TetR/AcrR family transcriptional regulator [Pseudonocardia halophobica]GLL09807.1 TetR family transcriptional regulator [Pseudonocardia halophobica]
MGDVSPLPRLPERRRRSVGEERRALILGATEELLRERSLAEISVGDIASAAGVARSGFYFYFASKGAVVTALLADVFGEMAAGAIDLLAAAEDPREAVRQALRHTWESWRDHQGLVLAMLDARGTDPAVRELWDAWIDRFVAPVAVLVEGHRQAGMAPAGVAAADLVAVLLAANERTFERLSRSGASPTLIDDALEALVAVWTAALYGPTTGPIS